jgi:hypothetical protein
MNTTTGSRDVWVGVLENPKAIAQLYDVPPNIIELFEMAFHRNGPTLDLVGLLDRFPERPPAKWVAAKSNRVLINLELYGLKSVHVDSWSTSNRGLLELEPLGHNDLRAVFTMENGTKIICQAMIARVTGFTHHWSVDDGLAYNEGRLSSK